MKLLRFAAVGLMVLLAAVAVSSAQALQVVDASDGKTRTLNVSKTEMTRIAVEGGRVRSIKYDEEELDVTQDTASGQVFVRPRVTHKPVSIFVITASETTHALQLQPVETGLGSIVIQETPRERSPAPGNFARRTGSAERAGSFDSELRRLVTAMARDDSAQDYDKRVENKEVPLWIGARLLLMTSWRGLGLRGEWYRLLNDGKESMRVIEQEFFQGDVAAVSVEVHEIAPGQHTNVFIVRREGTR